MKKIIFCLLLIVYCLLFTPTSYADYVLPYPSYMPGNKLYRVARIIDQLKRYWYFGNIAQLKYHLGLSDKYLVEAKTLMEYNQYLLATDALLRSDKEFMQLPKYLAGAKAEHVDISGFRQLVMDASLKHQEVFSKLIESAPNKFVWKPEKAKPTDLQIGAMLRDSSILRETIYNEVRSL